jgi:hypothetical protein
MLFSQLTITLRLNDSRNSISSRSWSFSFLCAAKDRIARRKKGLSRRRESKFIFGGTKTKGKFEALDWKYRTDSSAWLNVTNPLEITSLNGSKFGNENNGSECWCLELSDREKNTEETEDDIGCVKAWIIVSGGDNAGAGWEGADDDSDGDASFPDCLATSNAIKPSSFSSISATRLIYNLVMSLNWYLIKYPQPGVLAPFRTGFGFEESTLLPLFNTPTIRQNPCSKHAEPHIPLTSTALFTGNAFSFAASTRFAAAA